MGIPPKRGTLEVEDGGWEKLPIRSGCWLRLRRLGAGCADDAVPSRGGRHL